MNPTRLLLTVLAILMALPIFAQKSRRRESAPARDIFAEMEARRRDYIEKELDGWRPTAVNAASVPTDMQCVAADLSGVWRRSSGLEGARLKLFPLGDGRYRVFFLTGGCEMRWSLERRGVYHDGVLTLNRPVKEYSDLTYQRLFTIKTKSGVRLIADAALYDSLKNGTRSLREHPEWQTFANESHVVKVVPNPPTPKPTRKGPPRLL